MSIFFVNGRYLPKEEAKISVVDLGLTRGFGVFDYLRTYQRRPFHIKEHLQRLKYSAEHVGLELPFSLNEIQSIVETLIKRSPPGELSIKILVTGGESPDQFTPIDNVTFIAFAYPASVYPETYFTNGITTITTTLPRSLPKSKTIHYIPALMALRKGKSIDAQEALYLNAKQEVLEATTSNFFAFKDGVLITPYSDELLLGITREVVLTLAKDCFPIEERPICYEELSSMDECFITSSSREVMPVAQIDAIKIGDGNVGNNTLQIQKLFADYTRSSIWPSLHIIRHDGEISTENPATFPMTAHNFL